MADKASDSFVLFLHISVEGLEGRALKDPRGNLTKPYEALGLMKLYMAPLAISRSPDPPGLPPWLFDGLRVNPSSWLMLKFALAP